MNPDCYLEKNKELISQLNDYRRLLDLCFWQLEVVGLDDQYEDLVEQIEQHKMEIDSIIADTSKLNNPSDIYSTLNEFIKISRLRCVEILKEKRMIINNFRDKALLMLEKSNESTTTAG